MINGIGQFNNKIVMKSAVKPYFWQRSGLTLLYHS